MLVVLPSNNDLQIRLFKCVLTVFIFCNVYLQYYFSSWVKKQPRRSDRQCTVEDRARGYRTAFDVKRNYISADTQND